MIGYTWDEMSEEARKKIDAVGLPADVELQLQDTRATRVYAMAGTIGISLNHYHPHLGIGAPVGLLVLSYNHQSANYTFVSFQEGEGDDDNEPTTNNIPIGGDSL